MKSTFRKEIRLTKEGAAADFGRLKVYFDSNPAAARPVRITTPVGRHLSCRATFLSAYNTATDDCLLLATVTNTVGLVVSPTQVLYTNAFDKIKAHLRYDYDPSGISLVQDVILLESPLLPESFKPETTRLEVWTEWFDSDPVSISKQDIPFRAASGELPEVIAEDQTPDFGYARIAPGGRVFSIAEPQQDFPVAKTWARIANDAGKLAPAARNFLIEAVDYGALKSSLDALPQSRYQSSVPPARGRSELLRRLAAAPAFRLEPGVMLAQAAPISTSAVVFDFALICPVPVPTDIVSWWPATDDALDAMPAANNGTLVNGTTFAPGRVGPCFSFNGSQKVEIPDSQSLNPTTAITLDAWVNVSGGQGTYRDIISKDGEYSNRQYLLGVTIYNKFRAHIGVGNTFYYIDSTNTISTNTWYHVAMTYDGAKMVLYVNGVAQTNGSMTGSIITTTQPMRIGGGAPAGTPQYYFKGRIDEADIFSRALSPSEIAEIYNAGSSGKINPNCLPAPSDVIGWWGGDSNPFDLAGANDGNLIGSVAFVPGYVSDAFQFDGSSNVEIPDAPALNPYDQLTIEAWVYAPEPTWDHQDLVSKDGEGFDRQYLLTISDANTFRAHVGVSTGFKWLDGSTYLDANTWYHVAMTYDGSVMSLYVNGQLDASETLESGGPIIPTTQPVRIGGGAPEYQFTYMFSGRIDEPAIYNRVLSASEISAIYSARGAGKCKTDMDSDGLPDYWELKHFGNLNESGSTDADSDGLTNLIEYQLGTNPLDADTDYDGNTDAEELGGNTDPLDPNSFIPVPLAHFKFDASNWAGEEGQSYKAVNNVSQPQTWSGNGLQITDQIYSYLSYNDHEANGRPNINLRRGTVRFWFKPDWSSTTAGGTGPQTWARLIEMGRYDAAWGRWVIGLNPDGTSIEFSATAAAGAPSQNMLQHTISWTAGQWYQITLTYGPGGSVLYTNGIPAQTGGSVPYWPSLQQRQALGMTLGNDGHLSQPAKGAFDELETFNYELTETKIFADYQTVTAASDKIQFSIEVTNNWVATSQTILNLNVTDGIPGYYAVLVDSTNLGAASWSAYSAGSVVANLGALEGWRGVRVGLKGLAPGAKAAWVQKRLKLDTTPPHLTITSPTNSTVDIPMIQLEGYCPEELDRISCELTNESGFFDNLDAGVTDRHYDRTAREFTTNSFECLDIELTNGVNILTVRAADLAGNVTETNFTFTLDFSSRTNPPVIQLFWPNDGEKISGDEFTWRGWVDDPTATVTATVVDTNAIEQIFSGLVERDGNFWFEHLPMAGGTSSLTLTVTDAANHTSITNITVFPSAFTVTMTPIPDDQLWKSFVTATGTISDSSQSLWINGVKAAVANGTWTAENVPMTKGGVALFDITCFEPGETQPDGSHGN